MTTTPKTTSVLHQVVEQGYDLADSTRARYLRDLDLWIEFAGTDPAGWTIDRAQEFYSALIGRMEAKSANRVFSALGYAARWYANAQRDQDLNFALIRKAKVKPDEDAIRHQLSEPDAKRLLETCLGEHPMCLRDMALMVTGLETGMRRMSLQSMTFEAIELESKNYGYPVARVLTKGGGKTRIAVPMSDTALKAIGRWQTYLGRERGPVFVALAKAGFDAKGRSVYTPGKTALSEQAIHKIIAGRGTQVHLYVHPHLFRHTFVSWRMEAGLKPHEIAAITGHKISGIGAMGGYIDMRAFGERARNTTPQWLKEMFP